jgi:hypothetical protein
MIYEYILKKLYETTNPVVPNKKWKAMETRKMCVIVPAWMTNLERQETKVNTALEILERSWMGDSQILSLVVG